MLPQYLKHSLPHYLNKYNREKWSAAIDELKLVIKPEASPGVPYAFVATRNDILFRTLGQELNDIVLDRVERRLSVSPSELEAMSRQERIDNQLMDPVRVFVKNEPHSQVKLDEGRVRLIMSVSIVDKIIEMLLARHLYKLEIANWRTIPSKPGIGFSDENNSFVYDDIMQCGLTMAGSDMSGWDWSVKKWMIQDEAEGVIKLCVNSNAQWELLMRNTAILEASSVYQFSDGVLVAPIFDGIVNSGKQKTSRGNSFMRVRVADLIGSRKTIAAGDDCIESYVDNAHLLYAELGLVCKQYDIIDDSFEFCSRLYGARGSYPLNAYKMIMNLLHTKPKNSLEFGMYMLGFEDQMRSHPDFEQLRIKIAQSGYDEVEGPHYY